MGSSLPRKGRTVINTEPDSWLFGGKCYRRDQHPLRCGLAFCLREILKQGRRAKINQINLWGLIEHERGTQEEEIEFHVAGQVTVWAGAVARAIGMRRFMRAMLIAIGTACVALGIVGMFLPLLPTTPFLLLAAACFARSSERFSRWLLTNRWCGEYLRNYREGRGMRLGQKILTLLMLWLTIGGTVLLTASAWWVDLLLVGVATVVTAHLVHIKTYKPASQPANQLRPL